MNLRELADQLLALIAEHGCERFVHPQVAAIDRERDPDQGALEDDVALGEGALKVFLQFLALGDVHVGPDRAARRIGRIHRVPRYLHPDEGAVLALESLLGDVGLAGLPHGIRRDAEELEAWPFGIEHAGTRAE